MANKALRSCACPGCAELTASALCDKHRAERARTYDRYERNQTSRMFYTSVVWKKCRKAVLARDGYLCQVCLREGVLEPAAIVHHIKPLEANIDKALDADNLISVCGTCHNALHGENHQL